jgi:hypothetical protein
MLSRLVNYVIMLKIQTVKDGIIYNEGSKHIELCKDPLIYSNKMQ